jgi:transposase
MIAKSIEHEKSVSLRKEGYSYSEIAQHVQVSKASLSLWLSKVIIDEKFVKRLANKKVSGQQKGAAARKRIRVARESAIIARSSSEIVKISRRELWLLGTIAYWCEGSKQKENNVSARVSFSNSDPFLTRLFVKWLKEICKVAENTITYTICIHETADVKRAIKYWSQNLSIHPNRFENTVLKRHSIKTNRKNTGDKYYGLARITVRKSTDLNRKITGWITGISKYT